MPGVDLERLIEALRCGAEGLHELAAVILFGSHATGRARVDSDIDVAVLLKDDAAAADRLELLRRIITTLAQRVAADRLHITVLSDRAPTVAFEALRDGKVILSRDPIALHRFRTRIYRLHADYEHVERLFRTRTARRAPTRASNG